MIARLGFKKGRIIECIVTTYNENGSPNAAPMGVYAVGRRGIILKVHLDCDTYSNIIRNKGCVVNLIYDPLLFLKTTLIGRGRGGEEPELDASEVGKARRVRAPFIKRSHAYLEASLKDQREYVKVDDYKVSEVSMMRCIIVREVTKRKHPVGFNRGLGAAVELAIKLSRGQKEGCEEYLNIMQRTMAREDYDKINAFLKPYL
jgi:hypothetical protein